MPPPLPSPVQAVWRYGRTTLLLPAFRLHILRTLTGAAELVGTAGVGSIRLAVIAGILLIVGVLDRLLGVRLLHAILRWLPIGYHLVTKDNSSSAQGFPVGATPPPPARPWWWNIRSAAPRPDGPAGRLSRPLPQLRRSRTGSASACPDMSRCHRSRRCP